MRIKDRFRGFLPVVVDVETGGLNAGTDALLEVAVVALAHCTERGFVAGEAIGVHLTPFAGARIDPKSLALTKIDIDHPFRFAVSETQGLDQLFKAVRSAVRAADCTRAVLVGHNAHFDLAFLNAAIARTQHKRSPFHPFTCFDTATLAGVFLGQTVLAKALAVAGLEYHPEQAHSAVYDAERTAALLCWLLNRLDQLHRDSAVPVPWINEADLHADLSLPEP